MQNIVTVNVSQTIAPLPSNLQQCGAIVSQGATTSAVNSLLLLTQSSTLAPFLTGAAPISTMTWASGTVTVTTSAPHGFPASDANLKLTIAGATPSGYNGYVSVTVTSPTQFTYPRASNPGALTVPGFYTPEDVNELTQQNATFFAQGSTVPVYVLELGAGNVVDGTTALNAWIAANPGTIYDYLVPRYWDSTNAYLALLLQYNSPTSQQYFFTTTTAANFSNYTALMKSAFVVVEAPSLGGSEFTAAAPFYVALSYAPTGINRVTPMNYSYLSGVTPYPTAGNASLLAAFAAANINYVGTGAEGGISNAILVGGKFASGDAFTYWYASDWMAINQNIALSNEVINGSNNPLAPLDYDQPGINRLQARAQQTANQAVTYGLFLGPITVTAVPFYIYTQANPAAYRAGTYGGLALAGSPTIGFSNIIFNLNVSSFPIGGS